MPSNHSEPLPNSHGPSEGEQAAMYRIAYEQGLRTLDDQRDELNGVRSRAGAYMAFQGSATAFLIGATLSQVAPQPGFWFPWAASAGTVAFIVSLVFMILLLRPKYVFNFRQSPKFIINEYIHYDIPCPSEADLLKRMSMDIDGFIFENEKSLAAIRNQYKWLVIFGAVSLLLWISAIWVFGRVGV